MKSLTPTPTTTIQLDHLDGGFTLGGDPEDHSRARFTLRDLMEMYRVPALSLALIEDFHVHAVRAYGVAAAGSAVRATPETLFLAGSISKPVSAAGALRLVDEGRLSLDTDVNLALRDWKVPQNEFTRIEPVTLRRLLSHTAGTTVHFFPGYPRDQPVPTLEQVLDGVAPANTDPVRVDRLPGREWRYSGGGYVVTQHLMETVTGERFPDVLRATVFEPLGLRHSTFEQPLPEERYASAASGTRMTGEAVPGGWHVYPEMAACGLWTTAGDLAEVLAQVARSARGDDGAWMPRETARWMITPQTGPTNEFMFGDDAHPDRMGLGFILDGTDPPAFFGHLGDDAGFQALAQLGPASGDGLAVMTNSDLGMIVAQIVRAQVYRSGGWTAPRPTSRLDPELLTVWLVSSRSGEPDAVEVAYRHALETNSEPASHYAETLIGLGYALASEGDLRGAATTLKLCVDENPGHWNAHDSLGEVLALSGQNDAAVASYARSIELNPENRNAVQKLAQLKGSS